MVSLQEFENSMFEELKERGHIEHIMMSDVLDDFTSQTIKSLLHNPIKIIYNDEGITFEDDNGDFIVCPEYGINIADNAFWLSSKIPSINYDVDQGGNLRRGEEAEAGYCCSIVSLVLGDCEFTKELEDVIHNYNFNTFDSKDDSFTFKQLLTSWQDLQSISVNICISAAKYNISNIKKDTEKFLRDGIPNDLAIELRNLEAKVKDINRSYSTGVLSPIRVQNLTKIQILSELEAKNVEIQKAIKESNSGTLFQIFSLSSEYISPIKKKRLFRLASDKIEEVYAANIDSGLIVGEKRVIIDRWKRRFIKLERSSIRKREVIKFLNNQVDYCLPVKL